MYSDFPVGGSHGKHRAERDHARLSHAEQRCHGARPHEERLAGRSGPLIKGPQTGNVFELDAPEITIGRDPANTIFLNDMTVSRSHAKILRNEAGVLIEDLGSLNGTWVDGAIVNSAPLHDGSSVQIGTFTLMYHESTVERIETGE